MAIIIQYIIANRDMYCLISNEDHNNDINPYLGYDWNKKHILNTIKSHMIHRIHSQFFLYMIHAIDMITGVINAHNDMKSHTGYTLSNLVRALLSLNARIHIIEFVGNHITLSPSVRKIQKAINALVKEKKKISIRIFLFSVLFMLEKNIAKENRVAISNHTKFRLKLLGLIRDKNSDNENGK